MRPNSMIIDVSCDRNGGIESSVPTTIETPTYTVDGVMHYAVDHTPSIFHKTFSYNNSNVITPFLNMLIEDNQNTVLNNALIIKNGVILDQRIISFQNR